MPEVDWHGANGSIQISGEPASSRYTEARLSKEAEEGLLFNIKKHNVPMKLNFSEDEEWPEVFPAIMPRLMINGCQGIGSTIANQWLPHSSSDVAALINSYLDNGEIDYTSIAPSFPTGGIIINRSELPAIYKTGKGKVILRGRAEIKKNSILITEIPYQTYVEPLIEQIKELAIKEEIKYIDNVLNKSDKKRLLIEIECEQMPEKVLKELYIKTDLQKTFNANQYALIGKTPKLLNLKEYLDVYINHNTNCIQREYQYELGKAEDRIEIVLGLIKALYNIDEIISLIKKSDNSADAVRKLCSEFNFTERQARAIVDMKLGKLAHLERLDLEKEYKELSDAIVEYKDIVNNVEKRIVIYRQRFNNFIKKYGDTRKTELQDIAAKTKEEKEIQDVVPEDCVVTLTSSGMIKLTPAAAFKTQKRNGKGVKSDTDALINAISTNTIDTFMVFTDKGNMYKILADTIPRTPTHISSIVKMKDDEKAIAITSLLRDDPVKYVFFFTKNGMVKKTKLEEYTAVKRTTGIQAIKLKEDDTIANVTFANDEGFLVVTRQGMSIRFFSSSIAPIGRAAIGVKAINLNEGDEVIAGIPLIDEEYHIGIFLENGCAKKVSIDEFPIQERGGRGTKCATSEIAGAGLVCDSNNIILIGQPNTIRISAKEIPILGKAATGNLTINGSKVKNVVII